MNLNSKLIQKARKAEINTATPANIRTSFRNAADVEANKVIKKTEDFLREQLGPDVNFEISFAICMAPGIAAHVYTWQGHAPKGVGHRKCCFCGLDDFSE